MATLNCFFHLMMTFMLYCQFENVETTPECKRHITDSKERPQSTFELFHMHGPCSPTTEMNMPLTHDILHGDRLRVESLQARFKLKTMNHKYDSRFQNTKVVEIPVNAAGDNYAITISLGTPGQNLILAFDTASDRTWTRCFHDDKINETFLEFKPNLSTSFSSISCNSSECTQLLPERTCVNFNNRENTCSYDIQHVDGSHDAKGVLSMDNLKITPTDDMFQNWTFVCATEIDDNKNFKVVAGILGLARNSFVKQFEQTYRGMFSYCIPSDSSTTGFLKLGTRDYPKTMNFTPFNINSDHSSFYFINITSISVGNAQLSLNPSDLLKPGTNIDSRVSITGLPLNVYVMIRNEFQDQMKASGNFKAVDTCYDTRSNPNINIVPNITLTFNGGATLNFGASAALYAINSTFKCFAFAGNSGVADNLAIIGNTHQKNLEVVFDVDGGKLGFFPDGC